IPALPASNLAMTPAMDIPASFDGLVLSLQQIQARMTNAASAVQGMPDAGVLSDRSARVGQAIAILQSLATNQTVGTPVSIPQASIKAIPSQQAIAVSSTPLRQVESPRPQAFTPTKLHPQTRKGFWFNA